MIWYQILQENASDDCHQMFIKLVPGLGDTETFKAFDARCGNYVADSMSSMFIINNDVNSLFVQEPVIS